jgi:hypothetical protein
LQNAIFNSGDRGLWDAYSACLATLVGLHRRWTVAPIQDFDSFELVLNAFIAGFRAEFRHIDDDFRAGGQRRDAAVRRVGTSSDAAAREWLDAFASSEYSGWERMITEEMRRPKESRMSRLFRRPNR